MNKNTREVTMMMKITRILMIALIALALTGGIILQTQPVAAASEWTVTSGADSGEGTLRFYIVSGSVGAGDIIRFGSSITDVTLSSTLSIGKAVIIQGGLKEDGTPKVTINGNLTSRLLYVTAGAEFYNLALTNRGTGGAVDNRAATIFNHCVFKGNSNDAGAAISVLNSSPSIVNCLFTGNQASSIGGAISNNGASPAITGCTFTSNSAVNNGGGIYNVNSSCSITGCTFTGNQATGASGMGGAVYNNSSSPAITGCTFTSNTAANSGGAVYNVSSTPSMLDCTFIGNQATGTSGIGGAIYINSKSFTLTGCSFISNTATLSGGALCTSQASSVIKNCLFRQNTASTSGGGIYFDGSNSAIANCTFKANTSAEGGAIYNKQASVSLTNSILYADSSELGHPSWYTSGYSITYSDVQGLSGGAGNIDVDPEFVSPADLHLRSIAGHYTDAGWVTDSDTSPCIDIGNPDSDYSHEPSYSRGHIEMGAYGNTSQASKTTFTLSTAATAGGSITAAPVAGASVQTYLVEASAESGYVFHGWSGDLSGTINPVTIIMDSDRHITANFIPVGDCWYFDPHQEMEKTFDPAVHTGSFTLNSQEELLWLSSQPAGEVVTFDAGGWKAVIHTTTPGYTMEIGTSTSSNPEDFKVLPGGFSQNIQMISANDYYITLSGTLNHTFDLAAGEYLAVRISYSGNGESRIITDGSSYLKIPESNTAFPLPEMNSLLLLGLGIAILGGYLVFRRRRMAEK
jgi:uncharacterized repeat protein (TIGR02543 family)